MSGSLGHQRTDDPIPARVALTVLWNDQFMFAVLNDDCPSTYGASRTSALTLYETAPVLSLMAEKLPGGKHPLDDS